MNKKYKCFCCGYYTFEENVIMNHDICPVCFWENDGSGINTPSSCTGPNRVSLNEARENFKSFGASDKIALEAVRVPLEDEHEGLDNWTVFG